MGGGLIQLVAYGAQDVYLTGNPQITFFKTIYRRHTNFSLESIKHGFHGAATFGSKITTTIPRSADLLHKMYVCVTLTGAASSASDKKWAWVHHLGHALVKQAEISIGGQRIDLHTSDWNHLWHKLTRKQEHDRAYDELIGNTLQNCVLQSSHDETMLYIPLNFFFCRHVGQALPLIALQYHDVKLDITFESVDNLIVSSGFTTTNVAGELGLQIVDAQLYCDMVYLDTDERKRFAQLSHEMLVEQVQYVVDGVELNNNLDLPFNHPVKELVWVVQPPRGKYLWYHPTDVENMRLLATKRFVLALARYQGVGNSEIVVQDNSVIAALGLPVALQDMFDRTQAVAVSNSPVVENITILGDLLTIAEISEVTDKLFAGVTRPTVGDGAAKYDVALNMPFNYGLFLDGSINPLNSAVLQLNGHDRFTARDGRYFNFIQPLQHHTATPSDGVNVYSFAISPEELQPSGTLNFSRVDSAILSFQLETKVMSNTNLWTKYIRGSRVSVFALSYNVLRVMSGMAGLAFSN